MNILQSVTTSQVLKDLSAQLAVAGAGQGELALISLCLCPTPLLYRLSSEQQGRLEHEIEARLRALLREGDQLYAFGDGEWLILLPNLRSRAVLSLAMLKIERTFTDAELLFDGMTVRLALTCGAAIGPEHGADALYLLQSARIANLEARKNGGEGLLYQEEMDQVQTDFAGLERDLRRAFAGGVPLQLHLQPKINAHSGRCDAAEALLRWERSPGHWVPPPVVIGLVHRLGLRKEFNRWLFHRAALLLSELEEQRIALVLSINLSVSDLYDIEVPELIGQALSTWHIPPSRLCVEITETEMVADDDSETGVFDVLRRLREQGVKLSIDDFGTGFSGMGRLKQTTVDEVKIDRSFVVDILSSARDVEIASSIIRLSHRLGVSVTAEGVEDLETIERLAALGCDYFQGFYFSPALPINSFVAWVNALHGMENGEEHGSPCPPTADLP